MEKFGKFNFFHFFFTKVGHFDTFLTHFKTFFPLITTVMLTRSLNFQLNVPVIWKFCKFTGPVNLQNLLFYFLIFCIFVEVVFINAKCFWCFLAVKISNFKTITRCESLQWIDINLIHFCFDSLYFPVPSDKKFLILSIRYIAALRTLLFVLIKWVRVVE